MTSVRHKWDAPVRFEYKTERECPRCELVKVTRHEPGERPWIEWWRDGVRIHTDHTPACDARCEALASP